MNRVKAELVLMSPTNPRQTFSDSSIEELAASIVKHGLLHPIVVRPISVGKASEHNYLQKNGVESSDLHIIHMANGASGFYEVAAGERRFRAMKYLAKTEIPVTVMELTDEEFMEVQFIENIERKDVHPLEEAKAFKYLMLVRQDKDKKYSMKNLADDLGRSPKFISKRLKLNDLGDKAKDYLLKGYMNISQALELVGLPEEEQNEVLHYCSDTYEDQEGKKTVTVSSSSAIRSRVKDSLMKLEDALFDPKDANLTEAPACSSCEFNTSCQKLLFSDMDPEGGKCTNKKCFDEKTFTAKHQLIDDFRIKHPEGKLIKMGRYWEDIDPSLSSIIDKKKVLSVFDDDVNMDKKCPKDFVRCLVLPTRWGDNNEHQFKVVNVNKEIIEKEEEEKREEIERKEELERKRNNSKYDKAMAKYRDETWQWQREIRTYRDDKYDKELTEKVGQFNFNEFPEELMLAAAIGCVRYQHDDDEFFDYVLEHQPKVLDNYKGKIDRKKSVRSIIEEDIEYDDFIALVDNKVILQVFFNELIKYHIEECPEDIRLKALKGIGIDEKEIKAKAEKEFSKKNPEPVKPRIEDFETVEA